MNGHPYSSIALRRAAWHFLSGKVVSGLLTFLLLLWLVRLLPIAEYGAYVSLVAAAELAYALGGLGLPWASARYLPEARLHARPEVLRRLIWRLLFWQAGALLFLAAMAGLTFEMTLPLLGLDVTSAAAIAWAGLIFAEGTGRFLKEGLLGPLLRQDIIRSNQVLRQALLIILLALLVRLHEINLATILVAELAASAASAIWSLSGLQRHLRCLSAPATGLDWQAPTDAALWRVAMPMYGGHILTLSYGPQVFLLLLQHVAGASAAAVFGFLRNLYTQGAQYLPATLLFGLVRPKLVAGYAGGGGMVELARNANLAGKLSLFVLMPVVCLAALGGEPLVALLSGGKLTDTGLLFFGFMLALIPFSQRQLLETVAVTAGRAALCTLAAAAGLIALPVMLWLLLLGFGPWAGLVALGSGHLLFALVVVSGLKRNGYHPDHAGLARLAGAAAAATLVASLLPNTEPYWTNLIMLAAVVGTTYLAAAWLLPPFSTAERLSLNKLLGRELLHD